MHRSKVVLCGLGYIPFLYTASYQRRSFTGAGAHIPQFKLIPLPRKSLLFLVCLFFFSNFDPDLPKKSTMLPATIVDSHQKVKENGNTQVPNNLKMIYLCSE